MNKLDELLLNIKSNLKNEPCVKEYFYYKDLVERNKEIKELDENMRFHQKEMCKAKENSETYVKEKALYEEAKKAFDSNPILINYQIAKDEVYSLLVEIKEILS